MRSPGQVDLNKLVTAGLESPSAVEIIIHWGAPYKEVKTIATWPSRGPNSVTTYKHNQGLIKIPPPLLNPTLAGARLYSFDPQAMTTPVQLHPEMELDANGANLAGVLDRLRDREPERFEALNKELSRWLPEFDRILFDTLSQGHRAIMLRTQSGHYKIPAIGLSQGTLIALALLTLAYIPDPPPIICIEEPDRGIHPRLLRDVRDALYRLSYPESASEKREPVQVIATTHSPYMLDLFKDHPEEIVLAQKVGIEAKFERLSDQKNIDEILEGARLSDLWYSGILGGVPAHP